MKEKKGNLDKMGEKYSIPKDGFAEGPNIKLSNYFWQCIDILSCKMKKIAKIYETTISKEYEKESKIFDISDGKKILHIGCGAYPITALTLAKINGAKIVGIDRNPKSIKLAKNIVQEKNLHTKITIEQGDGTNYHVEDFDTIIISGCSYPKKQILEHVFENAKPQSKIILRASDRSAKSILSCMNLRGDITLVKKIKNYPFPFGKTFGWQSFYLIKNNGQPTPLVQKESYKET
jgi:precorrin-6B methylase 2